MKNISELIFGTTISTDQFFVFILFGVFGFILSLLFDIYSSGTKASNFSVKYFWQSNKLRIFLSFLVILAGIIFSPQLLNIEISNWAAFLAGFTTDKLIENLMQRKRRKNQNND